ncbi:MAG: hypothetical protein AAFN74_02215 [Myxococcota bacterium]
MTITIENTQEGRIGVRLYDSARQTLTTHYINPGRDTPANRLTERAFREMVAHKPNACFFVGPTPALIVMNRSNPFAAQQPAPSQRPATPELQDDTDGSDEDGETGATGQSGDGATVSVPADLEPQAELPTASIESAAEGQEALPTARRSSGRVSRARRTTTR